MLKQALPGPVRDRRLDARAARGGRGLMPQLALGEATGGVVEMSSDYLRLRLVKSAEEIKWLRVGCELTDRAVRALAAELRPGLSDHQLADICERAYVAAGGRTHIHYFGITPMAHPSLG